MTGGPLSGSSVLRGVPGGCDFGVRCIIGFLLLNQASDCM